MATLAVLATRIAASYNRTCKSWEGGGSNGQRVVVVVACTRLFCVAGRPATTEFGRRPSLGVQQQSARTLDAVYEATKEAAAAAAKVGREAL